MKRQLFVFLLLTSFISSCSNSESNNEKSQFTIEGQTSDGFKDGTYCADVTYYNPNTGTTSDYTLEVEVERNEVVQINFDNGGWLDSDHITPEKLNENGECTLISDRDYEYTVKITGKDCITSSASNPETDEDLPRYTFKQCTEMLAMTEKEIDMCLDNGYSKTELFSDAQFEILERYVTNIRRITENYNREVNRTNKEQEQLDNEIANGYVQNIERRSMYGSTVQYVTIAKKGVNYLFEVRGSADVTMGTAQFDEHARGWQIVYIRKSPYSDSYSGYSMRIIDKGI